jgi:hypothetical protein
VASWRARAAFIRSQAPLVPGHAARPGGTERRAPPYLRWDDSRSIANDRQNRPPRRPPPPNPPRRPPPP